MTSQERRVDRDPLGLAGRVLLDRYEVESAVAKGGMAIIYRGRDLRLLRPVCIKVFHRLRASEAAYRTAYEHFVQEAFALSQFAHPNTLRIYDFGYLDATAAADVPEATAGAPFQISEWLDGGTLGQWIRREGPRAPAEALALLEPVAGALAEAHARGIVHRDIKPSNILFAVAGAHRLVKLCDFGIAKVGGEGAPNRAMDTHVAAGPRLRLFSPGWAAPEQMHGEPIGPAADVYALGLVTAFVLTGTPVFSSSRDDDFAGERADNDTHVHRALAGAGLATPIAEVIRRACRERPADRFASPEALVAALRDAIAAAAAIAAGGGDAPDPGRDVPELTTQRLDRPGLALPLPAPAAAAADASPAASGPALRAVATELAAGTGPEAAEAPPAPLVLVPHGDEEVVVAGRRMRLVPMAGADQLDLGGDGPWLRSPARFRVTIQPSAGPAPRLNVKGLNCFVAREGARPTTAVDVDGDANVDLLAPDRRPLDGVRCTLGRPGDGARLYDLGAVTLAVPAAAGAVLLDLGPGRELVLLHRGARPSGRGSRQERRR